MRILVYLFFFFFFLIASGCFCAKRVLMITDGLIMGSGYTVYYISEDSVSLRRPIDSLLQEMERSLSVYNPSSVISQVNAADSVVMVDEHFFRVCSTALDLFRITSGALNPAVAPLVNAWGFGPLQQQIITDSVILDFGSVTLSADHGYYLRKPSKGLNLNFNALAQGYAADRVGMLLESLGYNNYLVEVGGEIRARGKDEKKRYWRVALEYPDAREMRCYAWIKLKNRSVATSGDYRNTRTEIGQQVSHIIDPFLRKPKMNNLRSVSVITEDAAVADGLATACMVIGVEKGMALIHALKKSAAVFVYTTDRGGLKIKKNRSVSIHRIKTKPNLIR